MNSEEAKPYIYKRFKLLPPDPEEYVAAFEQKWEVRLPAEYREFLLSIGSGGTCDDYRLFCLEIRADWTHIKESFPLEDTYQPEDEEARDELYDDPRWMAGTLTFFHEGCGCFYFLVVTGKMRGTVWIDERVNDGGLILLRNEETQQPLSFFDWFKYWDSYLNRIRKLSGRE
jgi:hypothetical protein